MLIFKAAYPLPYIRDNKFWPSVGRVDNVYGDRNLVCSCGSVEDFTLQSEWLFINLYYNSIIIILW